MRVKALRKPFDQSLAAAVAHLLSCAESCRRAACALWAWSLGTPDTLSLAHVALARAQPVAAPLARQLRVAKHLLLQLAAPEAHRGARGVKGSGERNQGRAVTLSTRASGAVRPTQRWAEGHRGARAELLT